MDSNLEKQVQVPVSSSIGGDVLTSPTPDGMSVETRIHQLLKQTDKSAFLVSIAQDESENPKNWTVSRRAQLTMLYGLTTFCVQFNSSVLSPAVAQLMSEFGVCRAVAVLPTALFVLGFGFGPIILAPLSEVFGRQMGVMLPFALGILFTIGTGASTTIQAVLINRFFTGLFSAGPVVSSGGILSDMWHPAVRGQFMIIYSLFVVLGPTAGSIVGTIVVENTVWQWSCWVTAILSSVMLLADIVLIKETYVPVLSSRRAKAKRHETGIWLYHAEHEEFKLTLQEFRSVHLMRPIAMLGTPIVFFITSYASFVFGVFYLFITSASDTFHDVRGWSQTTSALTYLWMFAGSVSSSVFHLIMGRRYARLVFANDGNPLPEQRLVPMMYAGWTMPVGLAVFAWTQSASIHWIVPCFGMYLLGFGFYIIFQNCLNYLVDAYTRYSASAIGVNTFMRSVFGASFPLFAHRMFATMHTTWGTTMLALVTLVMYAIPFVFFKYGAKIRQRSPFTHLVE